MRVSICGTEIIIIKSKSKKVMKKKENLNSPEIREHLKPANLNTKKQKKKSEEKFVAIGNGEVFFIVETIPGMGEKEILKELGVTMRIYKGILEKLPDSNKSEK